MWNDFGRYKRGVVISEGRFKRTLLYMHNERKVKFSRSCDLSLDAKPTMGVRRKAQQAQHNRTLSILNLNQPNGLSLMPLTSHLY